MKPLKPVDLETLHARDCSLERYLQAQDHAAGAEIRRKDTRQGTTQYDRALQELTAGKKETHWMWFIFPQIKGLGTSPRDKTYSIKSLEEAKDYLAHPILGGRIRACAQALLTLRGKNPQEIFEYSDDLKLRSCMTLFEIAADEKENVFGKVIDQHYGGERDCRTVQILEAAKSARPVR